MSEKAASATDKAAKAAPKPVRKARRSPGSSVLVHVVTLAVATGAAAAVYFRDKEKAAPKGDITVWTGRAAEVTSISYSSKTRKVELLAKRDETGRYYVGTSEREATPPKPAAADAGAPPPAPPGKKTTTDLMSVGAADKIAEAVAPLRALRAVGRVADDRAAEFGLAEPEGSLSVRIGSTEHSLVLGAPTPGGSDRYVKDPVSGEVFVVKGEAIRDLESAESRLVEHELHEWKDSEVTIAKVTVGGKTRELVRGGVEGKRFWADRASPEQNDETLGNWMSKFDRLRPTEYAGKPPEAKEALVRIEYAAGSKPLGYLELVKAPGGDGKAAYFIATERTRQYGKVQPTVAEQVEQDMGTVVK